jgi:hypothetical protein
MWIQKAWEGANAIHAQQLLLVSDQVNLDGYLALPGRELLQKAYTLTKARPSILDSQTTRLTSTRGVSAAAANEGKTEVPFPNEIGGTLALSSPATQSLQKPSNPMTWALGSLQETSQKIKGKVTLKGVAHVDTLEIVGEQAELDTLQYEGQDLLVATTQGISIHGTVKTHGSSSNYTQTHTPSQLKASHSAALLTQGTLERVGVQMTVGQGGLTTVSHQSIDRPAHTVAHHEWQDRHKKRTYSYTSHTTTSHPSHYNVQGKVTELTNQGLVMTGTQMTIQGGSFTTLQGSINAQPAQNLSSYSEQMQRKGGFCSSGSSGSAVSHRSQSIPVKIVSQETVSFVSPQGTTLLEGTHIETKQAPSVRVLADKFSALVRVDTVQSFSSHAKGNALGSTFKTRTEAHKIYTPVTTSHGIETFAPHSTIQNVEGKTPVNVTAQALSADIAYELLSPIKEVLELTDEELSNALLNLSTAKPGEITFETLRDVHDIKETKTRQAGALLYMIAPLLFTIPGMQLFAPLSQALATTALGASISVGLETAMSAFLTRFWIDLAYNNGDMKKTLKPLSSSKALKGLAIQALTASCRFTFLKEFKLDGQLTTPVQHLQKATVTGGINLGGSLLRGEKPGHALLATVQHIGADTLGGIGANAIAKATFDKALNDFTAVLAHGPLGAVTGALTGGRDGALSGALGGMVGEGVAKLSNPSGRVLTTEEKAAVLAKAQLAAALTAAAVNLDPQTAMGTATNAVENNAFFLPLLASKAVVDAASFTLDALTTIFEDDIEEAKEEVFCWLEDNDKMSYEDAKKLYEAGALTLQGILMVMGSEGKVASKALMKSAVGSKLKELAKKKGKDTTTSLRKATPHQGSRQGHRNPQSNTPSSSEMEKGSPQNVAHHERYKAAPSSKPMTVEEIINSSKLGRTTKGRSKQYERGGGMQSANKDFDKLGLSNIINVKGGRVGKLPDGKTVIVREKSTDGRPTLEIQYGNIKLKFRYDL